MLNEYRNITFLKINYGIFSKKKLPFWNLSLKGNLLNKKYYRGLHSNDRLSNVKKKTDARNNTSFYYLL
jgi:hypothetical protein